MEAFIAIVVLSLIGLYLCVDVLRFERHINIAEDLMIAGLSEEDAMEQSGCNFWKKPLHTRVFKRYPARVLPNSVVPTTAQ